MNFLRNLKVMGKTISIVFIVVVLWISLCTTLLIVMMNNEKPNKSNTVIQDTTYNHIVLDSIKYKIIEKDTIIYKLHIKMKEDVEASYNLDDSSSIQLFKQLVNE